MENFRIGNIEFRAEAKNANSGQIVCYYNNPHFGKEKEYNWTEDGEFAYKDDIRCRVHKSCFQHKECCYVVASIEDDEDEEPDMITVGSRPLRLPPTDFEDFLKVCKQIYDNL